MAIEPKRDCGFRKIGGLYLVGFGLAEPCDRLPFELKVCPVCDCGIKQTMGFTWIAWGKYAGIHSNNGRGCQCSCLCPVCSQNIIPYLPKYGLLWVGEKFYSPSEFIAESQILGVSKRIAQIPRELEIGKTWILLAHPNGCGKDKAGIFYAFRPQRIEKIITESQSEDQEEMERLKKRGITPVIVPDDDPDHRGSVYDKQKEEEPSLV